MATIAVLGMGLLGSGFAENLRTKGHAVRVWNRTASKCAPLVEKGAVACETPADAARGADRVHLVLAEDAAVDAVIDALRPGLSDGAVIVDHSTNLPAAVEARVRRLAAAGVRYLHAPVFMGPQHSRTATGLMLVSGEAGLVASVKPALDGMTGKVWVLGEEPGRAAALKLVGNGVLVMLTAAMGDALTVGRAGGLTDEDVLGLFATFQPTPAGMGRRVVDAGKGPVGFELSMARKDVRLMMETAGDRRLDALPAVAAAMDRALGEGRASEDYAIFARPR